MSTTLIGLPGTAVKTDPESATRTSKRALQVTTVVLGLVPVATGAVALLGVDDPLYASIGLPASALLDSQLRFFAGVWLGLGLGLLRTVPSIEQHGSLFRVLWGAVFLGGVGRLLSLAALGPPPAPFIGFIALEILGAPAFIYWQHRVAQSHRAINPRQE